MKRIRDIIEFWSSKQGVFESSPYSSGASYPLELAEVISKIETSTVARIIRPNKQQNMLDIGAGGGRWTLAFANMVHEVSALEPSNIYGVLKSRAKELGNVICINQSFQDFIPGKNYDLVVMSGVLTYLANPLEPRQFLDKIGNILNDQGYLVLREFVSRKGKGSTEKTAINNADNGNTTHYRYQEIIRSERFYVTMCERYGMKLAASFINHAPFFYHLPFNNEALTKIMHPIIEDTICVNNFRYIRLYDRIFKKPYALLRYILNLRSMKIFIFKKISL